MTGWRIGWACGNANLIAALAKVKSNIDSGIFSAIQLAGIAALEGPQEHVDNMRRLYQERRDVLISGLNSLGFKVTPARATFYIWLKVPKGNNSLKFTGILLQKADIVVTPGIGFGEYGEGYIRLALTLPKERIEEALSRLRKIL